MSIATEIERIQSAKASIKTAIENKGVTVGNGTISTYASKIDQIQTGSNIELEELTITPALEEQKYEGAYGVVNVNPATEVYEAGKKSEWNTFWDNFQDYGERTNYKYGFYGEGWNDETFKPKYDFIITADNGNQMFRESTFTDFKGILERQGIVLDTSEATSFNVMFYRTKITNCPVLDLSKAENVTSMFTYSPVESIDGLINIPETLAFATTFNNCTSLKEIRFSGTVGQNGVNFAAASSLSKASIVSVINTLSTTASGKSITFSKASVNKAFETSEGANDGINSDEWKALIASRSNWTITL